MGIQLASVDLGFEPRFSRGGPAAIPVLWVPFLQGGVRPWVRLPRPQALTLCPAMWSCRQELHPWSPCPWAESRSVAATVDGC